MTRSAFIAVVAVLAISACGGSDDDSASTDSIAPPATEAPEGDGDNGGAGDDCPYLTTDTLTATIGKEATLTLGDASGCQWTFPDGSQAGIQRFPAGDYETTAFSNSYIGDIDGVEGRWGNSNAAVLISEEHMLLFTGPLQSPPLRDEMQAIGRLLATSN